MEKIEIKLKECCLTCENFDPSGIKGLVYPVVCCGEPERVIACGHMEVCYKYKLGDYPIASNITGMEGKKMDYKELIKRIEDCCEFAVAIEEDDLFTTLKDAAIAIVTLLAEREAAG